MFRIPRLLGQPLGAEEQAGAAVQEEAGGFEGRDAGRVPMMLAGLEQLLVTDDPAVALDQIVIEHRCRLHP
ncbi:MAG: hypothetical protein U1G07_27895 [Verrucomicrobiota bacterium]